MNKVIKGTVGILLLSASMTFATEELERGFRTPPDSARPWVYWFWMNGNLSKEGITADLEGMKRAGLGGALIMEVDQNVPAGPVKFMGEQWWQLTGHAIAEADRLGLEIDLSNCAGWSSSGGPWITPELSMQKVVSTEQTVQGPSQFSAVLQKPQVFINYYRDIAVLAFKTPGGESSQLKEHAPKVTASSPDFDAAKAMDGDLGTQAALPMMSVTQPNAYVQLEFAQPFAARTLTLGGNLPWTCELQVSDDGVQFKPAGKFTSGAMSFQHLGLTEGVDPITARFYRVVFPRHPGIQIAELNLSDRLSVEKFAYKAAFIREIGYNAAPQCRVLPDNVALSAGKAAPGLVVPRDGVLDLTSRLTADGRLDWEVPPGQWTILRLGYTPNRCDNHPAPAGGAGPECDKLSKAAAEAHWAGMMQKVIDAAGPLAGKSLMATHIDSYEVGSQNWTAAFPEEFRRRRGYGLVSFLPVLSNRVVESPEVTERFLWDLRRTVAELFRENYFAHFSTMARRNGMKLSAEAYGMGTFEDVASGGAADIPMGEFWAPNGIGGLGYCKIAASSGHTYGKPIIGAESFTAGPGDGKWQSHPYKLKEGGDRIFCQGINRFIFHRYAMQPWTDVAPGMTMGQWGIHLERTNTWWEQSHAWMRYLARCQFLLQKGTFAADLCFFGNEDYLAGLKVPPAPPLPAGYDYDLCSRDTLLADMKIEDGLFALASGMRYRFLVLPDSKALTLPVVKKVRDLVAAGGTVIGPKPQFSPTLENYPACEEEIRKIAEEVWGPCDGKTVTENRYGKGRIIWGQSYSDIFASAKLPPDFAVKQASGAAQFNFIHRRLDQADWYFVANSAKAEVRTVCAFRVIGKRPELWDTDTGKKTPVTEYWVENGQTYVPIHFDPCGSVFVMFRENAPNPVFSNPQKGLANAPDFKPLIELNGPWEVSFDAKWFYPDNGAGAKMRFEQLSDWSQRPEEAVKYFSGTAVYQKSFDWQQPAGNGRVSLDLGRVEVIAEVELNGKNLGVLWKPPFRVDITEALKAGENTLVVKVTNLWPNRLIGDEQLPADCEYKPEGSLKAWPEWLNKNLPRTSGRRTFATWKHWKAQDPLLPSGLLGPVRVTRLETQSSPKPDNLCN